MSFQARGRWFPALAPIGKWVRMRLGTFPWDARPCVPQACTTGTASPGIRPTFLILYVYFVRTVLSICPPARITTSFSMHVIDPLSQRLARHTTRRQCLDSILLEQAGRSPCCQSSSSMRHLDKPLVLATMTSCTAGQKSCDAGFGSCAHTQTTRRVDGNSLLQQRPDRAVDSMPEMLFVTL